MPQSEDHSEIVIPDAPDIPGLTFRRFCGESDYAAIVRIFEKSKKVDQTEGTLTVEDVVNMITYLGTVDLYQDMLFVEIDRSIIGAAYVWWEEDPNNTLFYQHSADLLPEWRGKGIRHTMLRHNERRLQEIALNHPADKKRYFRVFAEETEQHWRSVLVDEGYTIMRYSFKMVRSTLDNIPDLPLPEGIEVRPVTPEHYQAVINAWNEACKDMRGQIPMSEEAFKSWQNDPTFDPSLWQVAWHKDQVIGTVLSFIHEGENKEYNRKRGHPEFISVARPWRSQGIAKALIARSLKQLKERGMNEAGLGVDAESPTGALHLYKKMGFEPVKQAMFYWKPLD
jgi:GNAT superfamily N-acetyltransferase